MDSKDQEVRRAVMNQIAQGSLKCKRCESSNMHLKPIDENSQIPTIYCGDCLFAKKRGKSLSRESEVRIIPYSLVYVCVCGERYKTYDKFEVHLNTSDCNEDACEVRALLF